MFPAAGQLQNTKIKFPFSHTKIFFQNFLIFHFLWPHEFPLLAVPQQNAVAFWSSQYEALQSGFSSVPPGHPLVPFPSAGPALLSKNGKFCHISRFHLCRPCGLSFAHLCKRKRMKQKHPFLGNFCSFFQKNFDNW